MTKNILHVVNISFVLPHFIGGQFDYFSQKGVVFFVACSPSAHLFEYAKLKGFNPVPLNIHKKISVFTDIKTIIGLIKVIRENKIDIVVGHTPKGGLLGMLAAYFSGIDKRIYFRHGLMYETSKGIKRILLKNIERLTGRLSTKVVCVSDSVLKISNSEKLSIDSKNVILNEGTCNGIDFRNRFRRSLVSEDDINGLRAKYNLLPSDHVIGFVGRLVNDKGVNELIEAWKLLLEANKNIKLLLIGPFEARDSIREELKEYISNDMSIIHTGSIDNMPPYYCLMDIFVLPSHREGFPTVILEASAMELPIVTTRATGCIDAIIENKTGLFSSFVATELADKIRIYLDNPTLAASHGKNGRSFIVENFDQHKIWKEIEKKVFELNFA